MEREIMLLSEAWERYQSDKKIEGYSPLTLKMYSFQYKLLKRYLGDIKIDEFTTEKLKQYLIESGGHLKPSSLGHRIRFIKSLFKSIHEEGYILKNPAAKLKEPKLGQRIPKFLSKYEIEHLREGCHTPMENALFEFFLFNWLQNWRSCKVKQRRY